MRNRYSMELHPDAKGWEVVMGLLLGVVVPLGAVVAIAWGFLVLFRQT